MYCKSETLYVSEYIYLIRTEYRTNFSIIFNSLRPEFNIFTYGTVSKTRVSENKLKTMSIRRTQIKFVFSPLSCVTRMKHCASDGDRESLTSNDYVSSNLYGLGIV